MGLALKVVGGGSSSRVSDYRTGYSCSFKERHAITMLLLGRTHYATMDVV